MRIAILGATSQISKNLVLSFAAHSDHEVVLFARRTDVVKQWLVGVGINKSYSVAGFASFKQTQHFDAIINFVGVGNPAQTVAMGASIFDVTLEYDELALAYLKYHPNCRYIFLSSGATYGGNFDEPVNENTKAMFAINNLQPQDWYAVAKLHAECRHRALPHLAIFDIRVFNYFSRTQDMSARFLITDIWRSIRKEKVLKISPDYIARDFLHPSDFYKLIKALLSAPANNAVIDAYSRAHIDKPTLLEAMKQNFGLRFEVSKDSVSVNATGIKPYYYSLNRKAENFGYTPSLTSLEGVLKEMKFILAN